MNSSITDLNYCRRITKALFVLFLLSVTGKTTGQTVAGEPVVYAAGYGYTTQGKKVTRVWKNYQTEE